MSVAAYLGAVLLSAATGLAMAVTGRRLVRALLPEWHGAPAVLAATIAALSILVMLAEVLGSVGLFRRWWIVLASVATWAVVRAVTSPGTVPQPPEQPPRSPRWSTLAAGTMSGVVIAQYVAGTISSYAAGMLHFDDLHYHLPQPARFVQTGWISRLHDLNPEFPVATYPANNELLHGAGMALASSDVLSPLYSVAWLGLLFLSAWCIGRPYGAAPTALAMAAAAMAVPQMAGFAAGSAHSDLPAIALLVAAVALAAQPVGRPQLLVAGAAAGLAVGTKLTMIAPVAVVALLLAARAGRRARLSTSALYVGGALATGVYWYGRNLVRAGSPLPGFDLKIFPKGRFAVADRPGSSVLHYLREGSAWRPYFEDGLRDGIGRAWPLLAAVVIAGIGASVVRRDDARRLLAGAAVVSLAAYVVTPTSALGRGFPELFAVNLRYAFGGVTLAMVALPLATRLRGPAGHVAMLALAASLIGASYVVPGALRGWPPHHRTAALALVLVAAVVVVGVRWLVAAGLALGPAVAVGLLVVVILGAGHAVQRRYFDHRYEVLELDWLEGQEAARIGVVGTNLQFQYYGADLSNHVQYVGDSGDHAEFRQIRGCRPWRQALLDGHYDYVVHFFQSGPVDAPHPPPESWTAEDPAARLVIRGGGSGDGRYFVYRLRGRLDPATCPGD